MLSPASVMSPELGRTLEASVLVGGERTPVQDLEFSINQLVEVALRAVSPGVNDPYTAKAVIDRLSLTLARIMRRGAARSSWRDDRGVVRLSAPAPTFEELVDLAFDQIRQLGANQPAVLMRLLDALEQLSALASEEQHGAFFKHIGMVSAAARMTMSDSEDLNELEERTQRALAASRGTPAKAPGVWANNLVSGGPTSGSARSARSASAS